MYRLIGLVGTRTKFREIKKSRGCWHALDWQQAAYSLVRDQAVSVNYVNCPFFFPFSKMYEVIKGLGNACGAEAFRAKRGRRAPHPKLPEICFWHIG